MRASLSSLMAGCLVVQMVLPVPLLAQQAAMQQNSMQLQPAAQESMQQEPGMQAPASKPALSMRPPENAAARLANDEKLLLVLNRFTYGPRAGDMEKLRAMGLNEWFRLQLNPELIDDSALDARLAEYPAMKLPLNKLMELYPTGGMVRAAMNGRGGAPGGDAAKAIYADQMERYKDRKKNGKDKGAAEEDDGSLPQSVDEIVAMPAKQRFKALCRLTLPQLKELRRSMSADQRDHLTDGMTPEQTEALAAFNGPRGVVEAEDVQVKLLRDIYSERQLNELMVDFWLNHFNVYMKKSQQAPYYIAAYEREAIRPQAMGKFENLLIATAVSPAMLNYLDNASSIGPHSDFAKGKVRGRGQQGQQKSVGLNENYGRELMELHTVGVNGGYSQRDVTEVAKVFTGWTVGKPRGGEAPAQAQFDGSKHEPGDKHVLGRTVHFNGQKEGLEVLHLLATSPMTARFLSTKLAIRFVSDDPPKAMIDRMAGTFLDTGGDIRRVLLTMINSPEFFTAGTYRQKVKTPQEYVVSAVRAAGSDVKSTAGLAEAIAELGMPLYGMQTPNGYSMKADQWNNTAALVSRMNFAMALSTNRVNGVTTDFNRLLDGRARDMTPEQKDVALEKVILHVPVSERTQKLIFAQTATDEAKQAADLRQVSAVNGKRDPLAVRGPQRRQQDAGAMDTQAALASGLIFGSPEFQRR